MRDPAAVSRVFQITVPTRVSDAALVPLWRELMRDKRFEGLLGPRSGEVVRVRYRCQDLEPAADTVLLIERGMRDLGIDGNVAPA